MHGLPRGSVGEREDRPHALLLNRPKDLLLPVQRQLCYNHDFTYRGPRLL